MWLRDSSRMIGVTSNQEETMTATETVFDGAKAEAFGGHIMSILKDGLLSSMVDIGHRTGLFAAAAEGWATSEQLAARSEEHTSELQSHVNVVCRLLLEK